MNGTNRTAAAAAAASRLLVVTAVAAERDAVAAGLAAAPDTGTAGRAARTTQTTRTTRTTRTTPATGTARTAPTARTTVIAAGAGPAAAAAGTAAELARAAAQGDPYTLVVSAGIAGGFAPLAPVGAVAVARTIVAADLGVATEEGFTPLAELGFGRCEHRCPPLSRTVARRLGAAYGPVLTVSTVTGTARRADELRARHPQAVAEAMEGFGVAEAAFAHGLPVMEVRTVSNAVGPRDRAAWRIAEALAALTTAFGKLPAALEVEADDGRDSEDTGDTEGAGDTGGAGHAEGTGHGG
jgi:futalosine hydrolase